jgi:DNA-binding NtrC family response regulator
MGTQVKLLRFLQEREFERVGGNETLRVDVRIVSATNKDLKAEVAAGRFREDLFFRLNVVGVEIPSLRTRRSDIPALAMFFVTRFAEENGKKFEGISAEALARLLSYDWPGNVRELENAIERAVVMAPTGGLIRPEHLPQIVSATKAAEGIRIPGSTLAEIERVAILKSLEAVGGSTSKAAAMLGISPRKIQYRLQEYREGRSGPGGDEDEVEDRPQTS